MSQPTTHPPCAGRRERGSATPQNPAAHPATDSQRRRREIFVATRTTQNFSSVRSDIFWRYRP